MIDVEQFIFATEKFIILVASPLMFFQNFFKNTEIYGNQHECQCHISNEVDCGGDDNDKG